jgi:mannose-6-phosphate isomerase-like protein (cupin superfamily)
VADEDRLVAAPLADAVVAADRSEMVLVEWADPGGGHDPPMYVAPLHVHHADDEAWYVVEGTLRFRLGNEEVDVPAGGAALAPRGTPHTYWNPSPEPARYVLVMTPRISALIDAIHAMTERSEEAMAAVFAAHESEYLGWP